MPRAHFRDVVVDRLGNVVIGASVLVCEEGTTTPVAWTLYTTATGDSTRANPFLSLASGIDFWAQAEHRCDLIVTPRGGSAETVTVDVSFPADTELPTTVIVRKNSTGEGYERPRINLIEGDNITLTVSDDDADGEVDVTIAGTAAGVTAHGDLTGVTSDQHHAKSHAHDGADGSGTVTKGSVGLGNVDNTSDATKNAASATLTNKTLTSPRITNKIIADTVSGIVFRDSTDANPNVTITDAGNVGIRGAVTATAGLTTTTGPVVSPAATTFIPSFRAPHGVAPSAPTDGDLWTTAAGLYARINGVTQKLSAIENLLTTTGDVLYASAANTLARLGIGTDKFVLGIASGIPSWVASLQSLMATQGDTLYASSANTPARLAKGTAGQVLRMNSGATAPEWSAPVPRVTSVTDSAAPTPNADTTDHYDLTALAQTATFGAPTGTPVNGQKLVIRIKDNGSARALAWNAAYVAGGTALPSTTVLSKILTLGFIYNTANSLNKWQLVASAQEA